MSSSSTESRARTNPLDLGIGAVGAMLMLIAVFLPRWETTALSGIEQNSLIQSGEGIAVVIGVLLIAYTLYRYHSRNGTSWGLALLGALAVARIVYYALHQANNTLYPYVNGKPDETAPIHAAPGIGIWMAGVGAALVLVAGLDLWLKGPSYEPVIEPVDEPEPGESLVELWEGVDLADMPDRITRRAVKHARRAA